MAQDFALPIRQEVIVALQEADSVTALISASNIFGATVPASRTFPFFRCGAPTVAPLRATGLDSSAVRFAGHAFTKPLYDGRNVMLATAEDQANRMAAAVAAALDGRTLALASGYRARLIWIGSNCLVDGAENDAWHAIVTFSAEVSG